MKGSKAPEHRLLGQKDRVKEGQGGAPFYFALE